MVTNTYEVIKELEKLPFYNKLLTLGIIPMSVIDHKVIYEFYCQEYERLKRDRYAVRIKGTSKSNTALEFGISERMVAIIIKKMVG